MLAGRQALVGEERHAAQTELARVVACLREHTRAERECRHAEREAAVTGFERCKIGVTTGHEALRQCSAPRMRSAAFSAIITTGALVFPDTSVGMMPQST